MAETMNLYVDSIRETDGVARVGVTLKTYRRHYFGIGGRIGFQRVLSVMWIFMMILAR